ncbi:hypothetical protein [Bradyrhizobium sp. GM2.2]|uniref:hypothetical protein n=1 Tax=Bradyrhizobium sp. GM2.2 TaxID=3156358 RepID=UPI00339204B1
MIAADEIRRIEGKVYGDAKLLQQSEKVEHPERRIVGGLKFADSNFPSRSSKPSVHWANTSRTPAAVSSSVRAKF